jgi:hypothetical protein
LNYLKVQRWFLLQLERGSGKTKSSRDSRYPVKMLIAYFQIDTLPALTCSFSAGPTYHCTVRAWCKSVKAQCSTSSLRPFCTCSFSASPTYHCTVRAWCKSVKAQCCTSSLRPFCTCSFSASPTYHCTVRAWCKSVKAQCCTISLRPFCTCSFSAVAAYLSQPSKYSPFLRCRKRII